MLVIGGHESANTARLAQLGSEVTETRLVETAAEIQTSWLLGQPSIGIASGASTSEETIDEVAARLSALT
jgi:4-hydroxy-3-methylbut-2-enyl diphosphate reductase